MSPFTAQASVEKDYADFGSTILRLRLDPIGAEVRIPDPVYADADPFRTKVEAARDLLRDTREVVALTLYRAVVGNDAPKDFDWRKLDRDDLEEALSQNAILNRRVETKDAIIRRYRMFMEASGKSWEVIEKAAV